MNHAATCLAGVACAIFVLACGDSGGGRRGGPPVTGSKDGSTSTDGTTTSTPTDAGFTGRDAMIRLDAQPSCAGNPNNCAEGQLVNAPPGCECLPGCRPGFTWNGTTCIRDDAGTVPDSGIADATATMDATPSMDATAPMDAAPSMDAQPIADSGGFADAFVAADGGGLADAQPPADAGAGADAGGGSDAATAIDAGFGIGLFEGDQCNPSFNDCRQRPGMVCEAVDQAMTDGTCMITCDATQNQVGTNINAACTGLGRACVDVFNLGLSNARCVSVVPPYGQYDDRNRLDFCEPSQTNIARVPPSATSPTGICVPLCTITPSPTTPVLLTCQGNLFNCDGSRGFQDGNMNQYGVCTTLVSRGEGCEAMRGRSCGPTDTCYFGLCRERLGTTCTSTTVCSGLGETCLEVAQTQGSVAFCHQPCALFNPSVCGTGRTCTVTATGTAPNQTVFGTCRAQSGLLGHGQGCADTFGFGANRYECIEGTECLPDATDGFQAAQCTALCDPANPGQVMCPVLTTCTSAAPPFDAVGICL